MEKKDESEIAQDQPTAAAENAEEKAEASKKETDSAGSGDAPTDIVEDSPDKEPQKIAPLADVQTPSEQSVEETKTEVEDVPKSPDVMESAKVVSPEKTDVQNSISTVTEKVTENVPAEIPSSEKSESQAVEETNKIETVETSPVASPEAKFEQAVEDKPVQEQVKVETEVQSPVKDETKTEEVTNAEAVTKQEPVIEIENKSEPIPEVVEKTEVSVNEVVKAEEQVEVIAKDVDTEAKVETEKVVSPVKSEPVIEVANIEPTVPEVKVEETKVTAQPEAVEVTEVVSETHKSEEPVAEVVTEKSDESVTVTRTEQIEVCAEPENTTVDIKSTEPVAEVSSPPKEITAVEPSSLEEKSSENTAKTEETVVQEDTKQDEVTEVKVETEVQLKTEICVNEDALSNSTSPVAAPESSFDITMPSESLKPEETERLNADKSDVQVNGVNEPQALESNTEEPKVTVNGQVVENGPSEEATVISWKHGGQEVAVSGDFNKWEDNCTLSEQDGVFTTKIKLSKGQHYIKFLVDGKWTVDETAPIVELEGHGQVNLLVVQAGSE